MHDHRDGTLMLYMICKHACLHHDVVLIFITRAFMLLPESVTLNGSAWNIKQLDILSSLYTL